MKLMTLEGLVMTYLLLQPETPYRILTNIPGIGPPPPAPCACFYFLEYPIMSLPAHQNSIHPSELSSDAGPSVLSLALCPTPPVSHPLQN